MKRIVTLTTAALMIGGLTSLGLAHESMTEGKQAPSAQSAPANTTPVVAKPASPTTQEMQPVTVSGKKVVRSKRHAAHKKMAQASRPMGEKKETKPTASMTSGSQEKKAEPTSPAASSGTNPTK